MTLRRGFKADAERRAESLRATLGLAADDVVVIEDLAAASDVTIIDAGTIVDVDRLRELEAIQAFAFSACTFEIDGESIIVTNPMRSGGRRNSDIAHELAHILLKHELGEVREVGGMHFRTCEPGQEEEATALGSTLLLPRPLLYQAVRRGWSIDDVARNCSVTTEMARYRINTTGVLRQVQHPRR